MRANMKNLQYLDPAIKTSMQNTYHSCNYTTTQLPYTHFNHSSISRILVIQIEQIMKDTYIKDCL